MAIHITPDGIGQAAMLGIAVLGGAILVDTYSFVFNNASFLGSFHVNIHLDERLRGLAQFILGVLMVFFGMGIWTAQVGAAAIITALAVTMGSWWSMSDEGGRGATTRKDTTVHVAENDQRKQCPLTTAMKQWCNDDHDGDGTINRYDDYFNQRGNGRANCKNGFYVASTGEACQ